MSVVSFKNANAEPDAGVVRILENALEMAKRGELRDMALVGLCTGNRIHTAWKAEDRVVLLGQLSYMTYTLMHQQQTEMEKV